MALRWYTVVVNCRDHLAQARWWAEALDWQVIFSTEEEAVAIPKGYEEFEGKVEWHRLPPGLVFVPVPDAKSVPNRLHLDLAPHLSDDRDAEIDRLIGLGATYADVGQADDVTWTVLADPEGNEFCVLSSRDR